MCIAIPARVVSLDTAGGTAKAELAGNVIEVNVRLVPARIGDYVLVHAGCAVEILRRDSAEEILSLFDELRACADDN